VHDVEPIQRLLTVDDVRDLLTISRPGLTRLVDAGELPVIRIGTRLRFDQADVAALIARGRSQATP
jgi:excisionase family DNA binding protein